MTQETKPKIIIVDKLDRVINFKDRDAISKEDIYRVSALWLTNSSGEILLAKRHRNKKKNPGKWGPAVSGTVEQDESYEDNIIKEAEEELGIHGLKFDLGPKVEVDNDFHYFVQWYFFKLDRDIREFTIQEEEVEQIAWFLATDLEKELIAMPDKFTTAMGKYYKLFTR